MWWDIGMLYTYVLHDYDEDKFQLKEKSQHKVCVL